MDQFLGSRSNYQNDNLKVNFLEYREIDPKGNVKHFTWITSVNITKKNVFKLMRGARSRWRIENETFNTLKNQGYNFEHNFGHGKENLCSVMGLLLMLAFLIDQAQLLCCRLFQQVKRVCRTFYNTWHKMLAIFQISYVNSWESFFSDIVRIYLPDTS